jgi:hypothetical protein
MAPILSVTLPTFNDFADRHGYEIVVGREDAGGRPTSWAKIQMLRRLLHTYDEVLWLDADVVILDGSLDISAQVPDTAWQALVEARDGFHRHPNLGVWYLRATKKAQAFLDTVWASSAYIDHPWWENAAVMDLLGFEVFPGRGPVRESVWMNGTAWLPQEWNTLVGMHGLARTRFRHYAAQTNQHRLAWMSADVAKAKKRRVSHARLATRRWIERHTPKSRGQLTNKLVRLKERDSRSSALRGDG